MRTARARRLIVLSLALAALLAAAFAASSLAATIRGTNRAETLRGTQAADRMFGRGGNDKLYGLAGADSIDGGPGADLLSGGAGNDRLLARDGIRDNVQCGSGRDTARADARDKVSGCETVARPPVSPPPVQNADLFLTLSGPPDPVSLNTDLAYVGTVTNNGPGAASAASLSLTLPVGALLVSSSATGGGTCQPSSGVLTCSFASIAPATAIAGTVVIRVSSGTSLILTGNATAATPDADPTNNTASITSQVSAPPPPPSNCDSSYPSVCIPPPPPDLDCGDIPYRNFAVRPPDSHGFDGDNDGVGCES